MLFVASDRYLKCFYLTTPRYNVLKSLNLITKFNFSNRYPRFNNYMPGLGSSHFARRYFGNHWPLFHKSRQIWKPRNEMSSRRDDEIAALAAFRRSNEEIAHFWASSWSGRILASFFVAHRQRGSCHSFLLASRICLKFAPSNWWHLWNRGRYCFLFFRLLRCFTSADTRSGLSRNNCGLRN